MMNEDRCPYCESDNYDTVDFNQDYFDESEISYEWQCECNECKKTFYITKWYKLVETAIKTEEEYNEE